MITYLDQNNKTISINPDQVCYLERHKSGVAVLYFSKDFHLHVPPEVAQHIGSYLETKKNAYHLWAKHQITPGFGLTTKDTSKNIQS